MENFERVMDIGQRAQDQKLSDQVSLFDGPEGASAGPEYTEKDLLPDTTSGSTGRCCCTKRKPSGSTSRGTRC